VNFGNKPSLILILREAKYVAMHLHAKKRASGLKRASKKASLRAVFAERVRSFFSWTAPANVALLGAVTASQVLSFLRHSLNANTMEFLAPEAKCFEVSKS
jgi:hypothetical protein